MRSTGDQFFEEFETAMTELRGQTPETDKEEISAILHQQRGASVMLGFDALAKEIDETSAASKNGQVDAYFAGLDGMKQARILMSEAFSTWLDKSKE